MSALRSEIYFLQSEDNSIRQSDSAQVPKLDFTFQLDPCGKSFLGWSLERSTYVSIENVNVGIVCKSKEVIMSLAQKGATELPN